MSALTTDRPVGQVQRRERADRGERQAEQDDERRDERVERQHHRQVDDQHGDRHRREQAAERLVLLLGHAGERHLDAVRDRAVGHERVDLEGDRLRHRAGVLRRDLGGDLGGRSLVDPGDAALDVDLLDGRDLAERHLRRRPDRQRLEVLDARDGLGIEAQDDVDRVGLALDGDLRRDGRRQGRPDLAGDLGRGHADAQSRGSGRP